MEQTYDPTMNTSWYKFEQADKTVYELYYVENKCSREYAGYDRCTLAQSINKEDILKIIEKYDLTVKDENTAQPGDFVYREVNGYTPCYFEKERLEYCLKEAQDQKAEEARFDELCVDMSDLMNLFKVK